MITVDPGHGLSMILTAPSALRWNMPYAAEPRRAAADQYAERVIFSQEGHDVGIQRFTEA